MSEITKTLKYELSTNLEALKKFDTWIALSLISAIILFLYKEFVFSIILLLLVLLLDAARNHATGKVTEFFRKKYKNQFQIQNESPQ